MSDAQNVEEDFGPTAEQSKLLNDLVAALEAATDRLSDSESPLVTKVAVSTMSFVRYGKGLRVVPGFDIMAMKSWRLVKSLNSKYFCLKFVPEVGGLVLPSPRPQDSTAPENFFRVYPEMLVQIYTAGEAKQIIKMVKALKPFPPRTPRSNVFDEPTTD